MRTLVVPLFGRAVTTGQHLSASTLGAMIDKTLMGDARRRAEQHLAECDVCRDELAACARLANTAPAARSRSTPSAWVVGAAAAVVVIALGIRSVQSPRERGATQERAANANTSGIAVVAPFAGAIVPRAELRFVWRRDDASTGYRVIVTNAAGAPAWVKELSDTVALPPTNALEKGASYFWRVEALHADGAAVQSPTTAFQIAP
jgi:hypothetical protein